jgi:Zn-dependent alcohol dehydrogenase
VGTFAEELVVPTISAVKIDPAMPLELAALIGCAVVTGNGAARHAAHIEPGDVVVVIGAGGVGLNIIEGARLAGADEIVAVDPVAWKLDLARTFGATRTALVPDQDPATVVRELTEGRGADVVLEAAGPVATIMSAIDLARPGGEIVLVAGDAGTPIELPVTEKIIGPARTVRGCIYGNADIQRDMPALVELYLQGELHLDELVTRRIQIDQINEAFADIETGRVARSLVVYGLH